MELSMKKLSLLIGLTAMLCGACTTPLPPADFRQPAAGSGSVVMDDASNETMPKTIDTLEVSDEAVVIEIRSESGAIFMGSTDSRLRLTMYDDYGCVYCREFGSTHVPWLLTTYVAKKKMIIERVFVPMSPAGTLMAKIAICSEQQDMFEETDKVLHLSPATTDAQIPLLAKKVKLNLKTLQTCMASKHLEGLLEASIDRARSAGVTRFPAFELGNDRWIGILTREDLQKKIEQTL